MQLLLTHFRKKIVYIFIYLNYLEILSSFYQCDYYITYLTLNEGYSFLLFSNDEANTEKLKINIRNFNTGFLTLQIQVQSKQFGKTLSQNKTQQHTHKTNKHHHKAKDVWLQYDEGSGLNLQYCQKFLFKNYRILSLKLQVEKSCIDDGHLNGKQ